MVRSRFRGERSEETDERLPETSGKLLTTISGDYFWTIETGYPTNHHCGDAWFSRYVSHWDCFWLTGPTIHHSEKITATLEDRQGSHDVHMYMSKTAGRRLKNLIRVAGVFLHFGVWHARQALARREMTFFALCHTKWRRTRRTDALTPGWEKLCIRSKTVWTHVAGTNGRGSPDEISQTIEWPATMTCSIFRPVVAVANNSIFRSVPWSVANVDQSMGWFTMVKTRERASATTLFFPLMCWRSVVISEISTKWRCWRGDQVGFRLWITVVSGRWSVNAVKFSPSKKCRKWRMASLTASSSLLKALYFNWAGFRARLKKAKGHHRSVENCSKTAPKPLSGASIERARRAPGDGWWRMAAELKATLRDHNFFSLSSVQIIFIPACCLLCVL